MLWRIVTFPFWIVKSGLGLVFRALGLIVSLVLGIVGFIFGRVFGGIFGAITGTLLGKKHVGIRLFTRKKAKK